jgi:hypothetical protein
MSQKENIIEVEILPEDIEVTITLPIAYYYRINHLILNFFPFKDQQHLEDTLKLISEEKENTPEAYHLKTLMSLQMLIEEQARKDKKLKIVKVDKESGQKINED